jgi:hypothetical protein
MELVALIAHGLLGLSGDGLSQICMCTVLIIFGNAY